MLSELTTVLHVSWELAPSGSQTHLIESEGSLPLYGDKPGADPHFLCSGLSHEADGLGGHITW